MTTQPNCACGRPTKYRGLCHPCYMKQRRRKNPRLTDAQLIGMRDDLLPRLDRYTVDPDTDCWEWQGTRNSGRYGMLSIGPHTYLTHRLSYLLHGGEPDHPCIMHICDNPSCMNPAHLEGGTYQDNMADMYTKGRQAERRDSWAAHLRDRDNHPSAKPCITPLGRFPSAAQAAEAHGIAHRTTATLCKQQRRGFRYL